MSIKTRIFLKNGKAMQFIYDSREEDDICIVYKNRYKKLIIRKNDLSYEEETINQTAENFIDSKSININDLFFLFKELDDMYLESCTYRISDIVPPPDKTLFVQREYDKIVYFIGVTEDNVITGYENTDVHPYDKELNKILDVLIKNKCKIYGIN